MIKQKKNSVMYSEIYDILNLLGSEYIDKIPYKFYQHIEKSRDPEYKSDFILDDGMIDENKIAKETVALFTILNLKYFIEDENEKEIILKQLDENDIKYQEELKARYSVDIFNPVKDVEENVQENLPVEIKKESAFTKIINCIKKIFKR